MRLMTLVLISGMISTAHAGGGRVLRTVQLDQYTPTQFVTVSPAGTVYATGGDAIYAVSPQGEVLWMSHAAPSDGVAHSISLGADETIYTSMGIVQDQYALIVALNPDGSTKWQYVSPVCGSLVTGPNVGPDGNTYGMQSPAPFNGLGVFALDPAGNLLWSDPSDLSPDSPADTFFCTSNIVFETDRLHTGYIAIGGFVNPSLHRFSLDGDLLWRTLDASPHTTSLPVVDPTDRLVCTWGQTGMRALSPDGREEWFALHPNGASLVERPAIDSKGVIFTGEFVGVELWAINPDGTTRWVRAPEADFLSDVAVSPDDQTIVAGGSALDAAWS